MVISNFAAMTFSHGANSYRAALSRPGAGRLPGKSLFPQGLELNNVLPMKMVIRKTTDATAALTMNTTTTQPNVPMPAGAIDVGEWDLDGGTARSFTGGTRALQITDAVVTLEIGGDQDASGQVARRAWINGNVPLTAADSRKLARALMAIGDELDRLSDLDE
jgi:hypothetical protein